MLTAKVCLQRSSCQGPTKCTRSIRRDKGGFEDRVDLENELKHYDEDSSLKKAEENSWKRRDDVLKHDKLLQGSLVNHVPWRPLKRAGNLSSRHS
jgi:hypothetical protein